MQIGFINLYDRNPTSKDHTVDVREAWVAFGKKHGSLEPLSGSSLYLLVGKAPKLERQPFRRLESYGLVSTAFNRFNDLQLQLGGSLGTHVYFAGQLSNGNPIFMRDPNALAGDNGTDMPPNPDPALHSGFPILYDAEVEELAGDGRFEYGGRSGLRFLSADQARGVDVMGYYYRTRLSAAAKLRGTFYEGDLDILDGAGGLSLPIHGDEREEYGAEPRRAARRLLALGAGRAAEGRRPAAHRLRGRGRLPHPARGPRRRGRPLPDDPAGDPLEPPRRRLQRAAGLRRAELRLGLEQARRRRARHDHQASST